MKYRFLRYPDFRTKAVTFSYDDGNVADVELVKHLNQYGLKATFNLSGTGFPKDRETSGWSRVTEEEALTIYKDGHDVAVHGARHTAPILSAPKDGIMEIAENRRFLENFFGKIVRGSALPDRGLTTPTIQEYMKYLGIVYCRVVDTDGGFALPKNWMEWKMTAHQLNPNLHEMIDKFLNTDPLDQYVCNRESILLAIWGHSFELPGKWELIDNIGEKVGGREDIWYVNNTDLYEYCHAYDSLIFSFDNTMVYNPTQVTVWFEASMKNYKIEPGETIYLS